ncbi:hypothetical protein ACTFIZ_006396 [Dictyostelium cf. discoideum]
MVKPRNIQHRNNLYNSRLDLTRATVNLPYRQVIREYKFNPLYWRKKLQNPNYRSGGHGGKRYSKYSEEVYNNIEDLLFEIIIDDPILRVGEIKQKLKNHNVHLSNTSIKRIFKKWKWSFKKPDMKQINKYTQANIDYYKFFLEFINRVDWKDVIFCDEVSYQSRSLKPPKGISPKGWSVKAKSNRPISKSCNVIVSINFNGDIQLRPSETTNDSDDFVDYIKTLIQIGFINKGKYFVIDNAPIHGGNKTKLYELIEGVGATLLFLPKYSPELNPIELVFAQSKRKLRSDGFDSNFTYWVVNSFCNIDQEKIRNLYKHCFMPKI